MCTNLLRKYVEGNPGIISARTMDFGAIVKPFPVTLKPNILVYPRNLKFPLKYTLEEKIEELLHLLPQKPLQWENKYGFVAVDVGPCIFHELPINLEDVSPIFLDGLNETGLSAATLWLDGSQYQPASDTDNNIMFLDLVSYVLGTCSTVAEVKTALSSLNVVCPSKFLAGYPAHYVFIDANVDNNALVVEYIDGKPNFYEVANGVLTNEPPYPQMLKQLEKYKDLTIYQNNPNSEPGLLGLPADSSPISRFVRATKFVESSYQPTNTQESIGLDQVIIQNLQVPLGTVVEASNGRMLDYTQWTVVRDHLNKEFYYQTFDNQTLKKIALSEIDFSSVSVTTMPMGEGEWAIDKTKEYFDTVLS